MARKTDPTPPPSEPTPPTPPPDNMPTTGDTADNDAAEAFAEWMGAVDTKMAAIPDDLADQLKRIEANTNHATTQQAAAQGSGTQPPHNGGTAGPGQAQGQQEPPQPREDAKPKSNNWYFRDGPGWFGRFGRRRS